MSTQLVDQYRLPADVRPKHYDLTFKTDLQALTFQGFAAIDLEVDSETSNIVFNSSELKLGEVTLHSEVLKTEQVQVAKTVDQKSERVSVQFSTPVPAGSKAQLRVPFEGKLTGSMMGYYHSSAEHEGKPRNYALTQFEPTAARRAFPCWDEPLLKATYSITLISREDTVNLSNMPAISEGAYIQGQSDTAEDGVGKLVKAFSALKTEDAGKAEGWKVTKFEKTPLMSSYLVAFANGHFSYLESAYVSPLSGQKRPLRIYATPDIIHQAQFALDVKAKVIPIYERVFDVEYPLPKLDTLIAHDFDAGAMENWGLITGRTSVFCLDPVKSDIAAKKRVATVQSHECAHMWFGDIVTMKWWDNLYLNEGFATLMGEVIIIDKVFPEWRVNSEFITNHLDRALELDAMRSSHPIEVECPDANQINQIFDALSYSKAGSILRMLAAFVGEEKFLKGVSIYLKKRLYGNSVTKDLWDGISEALTGSGLDVAKIMENWTSKIGFPVLKVTETENGITVRQDRFLVTGDATPEENETIWHVPLSLLSTDASGKAVVDRSLLLSEREGTFKVDTSKPFKLNAGTTGVFRVSYSPERLAKIAEEATKSNSVFSLEDRMGLVSDAMVLAKSGYAKTSAGLTLLDGLSAEKEYLVWNGISTHLNNLIKVWWEQPESVWESLQAFRRSLFSPLVEKLGYEFPSSDSPDTCQLRTLAVSEAAAAGDEKVIAELKSRFKHFQETGDDSRIPADLQRAIFATAVRHGGRAEYDAIKQIYNKPPSPSAKIAAMMAMTNLRDPALVKETFQFVLDEVRDQDVMYYFVGFSANRHTRRDLANFTFENFDRLFKRFEGNFSLTYLISRSFQALSQKKDVEAIEAFFKDKDTSKFSLALLQSLDSIRSNAAWLERSTSDVEKWLEEWKKSAKL